MAKYRNLDLPEEDKKKITGENARKVLGI